MPHADSSRALEPHELPETYYLCRFDRVERRFRELEAAFQRRFDELRLTYSYKTNSLPYLLRRIHAVGIDAEVVSALEYDLARHLGLAGERIIWNGPGKSPAALEKALEDGALVHLDSLEEVGTVLRLAGEGLRRPVGLRLNLRHPEGEGHRAYSRFGLAPEALIEAARRLAAAGVTVAGLHAHLSTKARDTTVFRHLVGELAGAARRLEAAGLGGGLETLDVGGGFGWAPPEMPGLHFPSFEEIADTVHDELAPVLGRRRLILEPGIAVVGGGFAYVAPILALKEIAGRHLAVVDGSVHTVKPTRHRHPLPTTVLDAAGHPKDGPRQRYDVVGYTCMDDDYLAIDQELPELAVGDRLVIDRVGAYTLAFKPPFIRPRPAVLAEEDGRLVLAAREETLEDMLRGDIDTDADTDADADADA